MARDVGPDLERVGLGDAGVEAVGPAARGRGDERARAAVAELRLVLRAPSTGCSWPTASAAAASGRSRPRGCGLRGHVERVGLQLARRSGPSHRRPAPDAAARSKHDLGRGRCPGRSAWRLARMRFIGPVCGTPRRRRSRARRAWRSRRRRAKRLTSPSRSASACARSRHQAPSTAAPAAASPIVTPGPGLGDVGQRLVEAEGDVEQRRAAGRRRRRAPSRSRTEPGREVAAGRRVPQADAGGEAHRPAARVPGARAARARRPAGGAGRPTPSAPGATTAPVAASRSSAVAPWTVRNSCAGERTPGAVRPRRSGVARRRARS